MRDKGSFALRATVTKGLFVGFHLEIVDTLEIIDNLDDLDMN